MKQVLSHGHCCDLSERVQERYLRAHRIYIGMTFYNLPGPNDRRDMVHDHYCSSTQAVHGSII